MNEKSLTLEEAIVLRSELIAQGVTITTPIPELPVGLYGGKFQTQKKTEDKKQVLKAVIDYIPYNRDGKAMGFFAAKANLSNDTKSYTGINIGLTEEMESQLADSTNLVKDYTFRSKQGRVRTFVSVED